MVSQLVTGLEQSTGRYDNQDPKFTIENAMTYFRNREACAAIDTLDKFEPEEAE
jgi:hypothetical protein